MSSLVLCLQLDLAGTAASTIPLPFVVVKFVVVGWEGRTSGCVHAHTTPEPKPPAHQSHSNPGPRMHPPTHSHTHAPTHTRVAAACFATAAQPGRPEAPQDARTRHETEHHLCQPPRYSTHNNTTARQPWSGLTYISIWWHCCASAFPHRCCRPLVTQNTNQTPLAISTATLASPSTLPRRQCSRPVAVVCRLSPATRRCTWRCCMGTRR